MSVVFSTKLIGSVGSVGSAPIKKLTVVSASAQPLITISSAPVMLSELVPKVFSTNVSEFVVKSGVLGAGGIVVSTVKSRILYILPSVSFAVLAYTS